jgi:hypothetical protein
MLPIPLFYTPSISSEPSTLPYVGQAAYGGVVIYVFPGGMSGLVVSLNYPNNTPFNSDVQWGCGSPAISPFGVLAGATFSEIGYGQYNTNKILAAGCSSVPSSRPVVTCAANYCDSLVENGYSDWYLPSRDEMSLFNATFRNAYGAPYDINYNQRYWTSTEIDSGNVYNFFNGSSTTNSWPKDGATTFVLPFRTFYL